MNPYAGWRPFPGCLPWSFKAEWFKVEPHVSIKPESWAEIQVKAKMGKASVQAALRFARGHGLVIETYRRKPNGKLQTLYSRKPHAAAPGRDSDGQLVGAA